MTSDVQPRSVTGPATWGQRFMWDTYELHRPLHLRHNMRLCVEVPDLHWDRKHLIEVITGYLSTHESFRTRFHLKGSLLMQTIEPELGLQVQHLVVDDDLELEPFERLWSEADDEPFEPEQGDLLRVALGISSRRVRFVALSASHMTIDGAAINVLIEDLYYLLRNEPVRATGAQPLDWSDWERSDRGEEAHLGSMRQWRKVLEVASRDVALSPVTGGSSPRYQQFNVHSPTAFRASEQFATAKRSSPATVLVAAALQAWKPEIGSTSGSSFTCRVGNRHHRAISRSIGTFVQVAPGLDENEGLDLRGLQSELFRVYRSGLYDPTRAEELLAEFDLTGYSSTAKMAPPFQATINYISGVAGDNTGPSEYTQGIVTDHEFVGMYLDAYVEFDYLSLLVDTHRIPVGRARQLLPALERHLLALCN